MSYQAVGSHSASRNVSVREQLKDDWHNREFIEVVGANIKKITDFLNSFDLSCRTKLANLNEKLGKLERKIEFLEARVTRGETLN